jgi:uncharacterized protein (TIGR00730 family)
MRICVFTGSSVGRSDAYRSAAEELGRTIAGKGLGLVYGGAAVGLMRIVADAALSAGGEVIGVLPRKLADQELEHRGLSKLHLVETMHERKALMAELSDAFAVLPGGIGTLEEAFEVWTWSQLGFHSKPVGLLNVNGFFSGLNEFLDSLVREQFLKTVHRNTLLCEATADRLVGQLLTAETEYTPKWIAR